MERCDGNLLLLGDDEEKQKTCERLIRTWSGREGALVVFDSRGWNEEYGDGHLAAFGAGNVPDYLKPVLQHPELGATPGAAAEYLAPICTPKSFRLNVTNDEFWENMAFQTNAQYLEYQVALLKREDDGHALRTAAKRHRLLLDGMEAIALSNKDEIEGQIKKIKEESAVDRGPDPRIFPEDDPFDPAWKPAPRSRSGLSSPPQGQGAPKEARPEIKALGAMGLFQYTTAPFKGTLMGKGGTQSGHLALSVLRTAQTQHSSLAALFNAMIRAEKRAKLPSGAPFDVKKFVRTPTKPLFVPALRNPEANAGLAQVALAGLCAAADAQERRVTFLVPDLERWGLWRGLLHVLDVFPESVRFIVGYGDLYALRQALGQERRDEAVSQLLPHADAVAWHHTQDQMLNDIFKERFSNKVRVCELNMLEGYVAWERKGRKLEFIPEDDWSEPERPGPTGDAPAERSV